MSEMGMIVKKNLSEQIYDSVKRDILNQNIKFGEKLVNRNLQKKYGVSSTPIRDAINRLYLDGLLDDISNGGARVISFDFKAAVEVNEIMSVLTSDAVAMALAKNRKEEVAAALERNMREQIKNVDNKNYFVYDKKFHNVFFEYCGNTRFANLYNQYSSLWELLVLFYYSDKESTRGHALEQHEIIAASCRAGKVAAAQKMIAAHFNEAVRPLANLLNK